MFINYYGCAIDNKRQYILGHLESAGVQFQNGIFLIALLYCLNVAST